MELHQCSSSVSGTPAPAEGEGAPLRGSGQEGGPQSGARAKPHVQGCGSLLRNIVMTDITHEEVKLGNLPHPRVGNRYIMHLDLNLSWHDVYVRHASLTYRGHASHSSL